VAVFISIDFSGRKRLRHGCTHFSALCVLTTLLCKKSYCCEIQRNENRMENLAESSKEDYGSKMAVLLVLMMIIVLVGRGLALGWFTLKLLKIQIFRINSKLEQTRGSNPLKVKKRKEFLSWRRVAVIEQVEWARPRLVKAGFRFFVSTRDVTMSEPRTQKHVSYKARGHV
jgi:hypothetical protein